MKKQIMISMLVLLVCKTASFACVGPNYVYYNQAYPKKQIIIGQLSTSGPLLAFNLKGEILPGFDKINNKIYGRYDFEEQDGIVKRTYSGVIQFFDGRNQFAPIGESYVSATVFSEGFAIVAKKEERLKIIDEKGNTIAFINDYKGKIIDLARAFSNGLSAVRTEDNLWGFIDTKGNMVIPPQYTDVSSFNESFCVVEMRLKEKVTVGIIDQKGSFVFPLTSSIKLTDKVSNGLIGFKKQKKAFGVMDVFGKEVIAPSTNINWIGAFHKNNMAPFSNGRSFGIINKNGKIIAKTRYELLHLLDNYYIAQNPNTSLIELIDYKGKLVKVLPHSSLTPLSNGNFISLQNSGGFILNSRFEEVMEQPIVNRYSYRSYDAEEISLARTDFFDTRKILASPLFALTKNGVAGLKSGNDVSKMIEVFKLDEDKRMSSRNDDDFSILIYPRDRSYGESIYTQFYGDILLEVNLEDETSEDELIMIRDIEAMEELMEDGYETDKIYQDTLNFLSDKKIQDVTINGGHNIPYSFKYSFVFNDFIKKNQFEEKQNTCNICRLLGTSINTKAVLTGFELTISLLGKASGKADPLMENLLEEIKKLGLTLTKKEDGFIITDSQQKDKKVGYVDQRNDSEVFLSFNF